MVGIGGSIEDVHATGRSDPDRLVEEVRVASLTEIRDCFEDREHVPSYAPGLRGNKRFPGVYRTRREVRPTGDSAGFPGCSWYDQSKIISGASFWSNPKTWTRTAA